MNVEPQVERARHAGDDCQWNYIDKGQCATAKFVYVQLVGQSFIGQFRDTKSFL